ncbi:MAG: dihydrodipicolinate synthase family protein, partial [Clostridia bacterium]|nr:dihydrodipicolinate synthase family protein [Clostridia bacterium]
MIRGSIVALITPFHEDGNVNYEKLRELILWHIEQGTDGICILGTTAETPALTVTERDKIVEVSIEVANKRIPIIVGSGSNNTLVAKEQSIIMLKDFLADQAKGLGTQVSEQQMLSFSREMIEETQ